MSVVHNKQKVNKIYAQVDQFFRSKYIQGTMRNSFPPLVIVQMRRRPVGKLVSALSDFSINVRHVKSFTSDMRWPDIMFITEGNPHLTIRFCGFVLGPTTIFKMVSKPHP